MRKIIIDADGGTDDFLALLWLLKAEEWGEVKIEGIICTMGNTTLQHVERNTVRLLETAKRTDIPIYRGTKYQLILPNGSPRRSHGSDGFGDLEWDKEPDTSIISDVPASVAIRNIVDKHPNEISIICVGPLTNLALAIKLYDDIIPKIKDVWIMGGNYTGRGNVTQSAEHNFYVDPEAASIVLECIESPIYILPWETCLESRISTEWRHQQLGDSTPELEMVSKAEKALPRFKNPMWVSCDTFLIYCFLNPEKHITKKTPHHARVELHGNFTRGQVVLDHLRKNDHNVEIIEEFDTELFKKSLLKLK
ncbi:unnamed protein product [Phaedon cochleariae]|uniref:Inosine/uridine-preferring nucleoside hydrolase domain-containing protein n=1 Tax=Phaedon cochleariae TaxID=80249 RepID=A0A9P0DXC1_PHACE|nr:unnamed protein product [Phaedon cochleariae]